MTKTDMQDVSNSSIYKILAEQVLPCLKQLGEGQIRQDGAIDHLRSRSEAHSTQLGELREQWEQDITRISILEKAVAVLAAVTPLQDALIREVAMIKEDNQDRRIDEGDTDRKALWVKIWAISKEVMELAAAVGLITKLLKLW
jgi:hypothetical protein